MDHVQIKPEDTIGLTVVFDGVLGTDLLTVAGRETVRASMERKAAAEIDEFFTAVTVVEQRHG